MHLTDIAADSDHHSDATGGGGGVGGVLSAEARAALRFALRTLTLFFLEYAFGPANDLEARDFEYYASLWLFVYAAVVVALGLIILAVVFALLTKIFFRKSSSSSSSSADQTASSAAPVSPLPVLSGFELLPQHPAAVAVNLLVDAAVCGWVSSREMLFFWAAAELGFDIVLAVAQRIRQYRSTRLMLSAMQAPVVIVSSALVGVCIAASLLASLAWEADDSSDRLDFSKQHGADPEPFFFFFSSVFFLCVVRSLLYKTVTAEKFSEVFSVVVMPSNNLSQRSRRQQQQQQNQPPALHHSFIAFGTDLWSTVQKLLLGAGRTLLLALGAMFLSKMVRLNGSTTDSVFEIAEFALSDLIISPRFTLAVFWIVALTPVVMGVAFSARCGDDGGVAAPMSSTSSLVATVPFVELMKGASSRFPVGARTSSAVGFCATAAALCATPMSLSCALWSSSAGATSSSNSVSDLLFAQPQQQQQQQHKEPNRLLRLARFFAFQSVAVWAVFFLVRPGGVLMAFLWTFVGVTLCSGLLALASSFSMAAPFTESFTALLRTVRGAQQPTSSFEDPVASSENVEYNNNNNNNNNNGVASSSSLSSFRTLLVAIWDDSHERRLLLFFILTASFMFVEFFVGAASDSLGLISDAFHMLVDATSIFIGLAAAHAARWKPTKSHPFGFSRYEAMSGLFNGILLVVVAVHISVEAFQRMQQERVVDTGRVIWVSVAGLLLNVVGVVFFHDWSEPSTMASEPNTPVCRHCMAKPKQQPQQQQHSSAFEQQQPDDNGEHSPPQPYCPHKAAEAAAVASSHEANMRGVFLHVLADLLGSVAVVTSTIIIQFTGLYIVDAICAMVVSLLILFASYSLLSATFETLTVDERALLRLL